MLLEMYAICREDSRRTRACWWWLIPQPARLREQQPAGHCSGDTVNLWDASSGSTSELLIIDDNSGPITSVNWAPDGQHIAVGLNSSDVQLWDTSSNWLVCAVSLVIQKCVHVLCCWIQVVLSLRLRTLKGVHEARVGSLTWNNNILTTGGIDGKIVNNDVRIRNHVVQTYEGHSHEVCGLKWSGSGAQSWMTPIFSLTVKFSNLKSPNFFASTACALYIN